MTKLMWLAGAAALAMAGTAQAQSDVQVEEVVVTAQKREGTVQATPLAVSAISGDVLQQQNVVDAGDLTGKVPNLNIGQAGNEVIISIRGVSSAGVVPQRDPRSPSTWTASTCRDRRARTRCSTIWSAWKCCVGRRVRSGSVTPPPAA